MNQIPIGIDFGSSKSILSIFQNSSPTIILSDDSSRELQNIITFASERRHICTIEAANAFKKHYQNTILYPLIFLTPRLNQYHLSWNFTDILLKKQGIVFQVKNGDEQQSIEIVQAIAMIFEKFKQELEKDQLQGEKLIVLGIPPYFSNYERNILLQASHLANLPIQKLLHESSAIGLTYACSRIQEFKPNSKRYVIFIDIGFLKTGCFLLCFEDSSFTVLKTLYNQELGVSNIDSILLQYLCAAFAQINKCSNPYNNDKCKAKLLGQVQKTRTILSANQDANVLVENFYLDYDFSLLIKREEFQKIIEKDVLVKLFCSLFNYFQKSIKNEPYYSQIDCIELLGGGTRIPCFQKVISEVFSFNVNRTMNSNEAIAIGCNYHAVQLNPTSEKQFNYFIQETCYYDIIFRWKYTSNQEFNIEQVFSAGTIFPTRHIIEINFENQDLEFQIWLKDFKMLNYKVQVTTIFQQIQSQFQMNKYSQLILQVYTQLDNNGIFSLSSVQLYGCFQDKNAWQQQYLKELAVEQIENEIGKYEAMQIEEFKAQHDIMKEKENVVKMKWRIINQLESELYEIKQLKNTVQGRQFITELEKWLQNNRELATLNEAQEQYENFLKSSRAILDNN